MPFRQVLIGRSSRDLFLLDEEAPKACAGKGDAELAVKVASAVESVRREGVLTEPVGESSGVTLW